MVSSKVTFKVGNREKALIYDKDNFLREIYNSVKVAKRIFSHMKFKLENNLESIKMEVVCSSTRPT